jgi:hypothetical protein
VIDTTEIGFVRVIYAENGKKRSATGEATDEGAYLRIDLKESKRRKKFNTIILPWHVISKVVVLEPTD